VTFASTTGTLRLDHSSTFTGTIYNFTGNGTLYGSDKVDLRDVNFSSAKASYADGVLTVSDGSGDVAKLNFNGSYTLSDFKLASDHSGGTIIYDPPVPTSSTPSANQMGSGSPSADSLTSNLARFGNYMASTFATPGHVGGTVIAEASHSDQSFLSAPKHT
jgi:hypothetical protein